MKCCHMDLEGGREEGKECLGGGGGEGGEGRGLPSILISGTTECEFWTNPPAVRVMSSSGKPYSW